MDDLLDREDALAALDAAWGDSEAGRFVVVSGAAGIGKTSVLAAFRRRLGDQEAVVLGARGVELEQGFPFGVVRQLLERFLLDQPAVVRRRVLAGSAAPAGRVLGGGPRDVPLSTSDALFSTLHALHWTVGNLAADRRLVLLVDDAHWADAESAAWLGYLARRAADIPVLTVVALREDDPLAERDALASLLREPQVGHVALEPLSTQAVGTVLTSTLGITDPALAVACRTATGGNAFLVSELVRDIQSTDTKATPEAIALLGPASIARAAVARMARLSGDAVRVGRSLAVLGSAGARELSQMTGLSFEAVAVALDDLARAGLLSDARPIEFRHPVVRAAIDQELPPMERAAAHLSAARIRAAAGSEVDAVVAHLKHTEPAGDTWVASVLAEGGRLALARAAPASALVLLDRALAEPPPDAVRAEVMREAAAAALAMGSSDAVSRLKAAFDASPEPRVRAQIARALGGVLLLAGQATGALDVLERVVCEIPDDEREIGLAVELDIWRAGQFGLAARRRATDRRPRFVPSAVEARQPGVAARNAIEKVLIEGPAPTAAEMARGALAGGGLLAAEGSESPIFQMAANALTLAGDIDGARGAYDEAIAQASQRGSLRGFALCHAFRALVHRAGGSLRDAEIDARTFLEHRLGGGPAHRVAVAALVATLVDRGELNAATEVLRDEAPEPGDEASAGHLLQARARLALALGRPEDALALLRELADHEVAWGIGTPAMTQWRAHAARAHMALGDGEAARRRADEEIERARRFASPVVLGIALLAGAAVERTSERLREAVGCLARSPARFEYGRALIELGADVRRGGRNADARPLLSQGIELARECAAVPLTERGYDELEAAGSRPRRIMRTGVDALTPSERRVALMAAKGLTNRDMAQSLFLSVRTVETHLGRAYQKLGVTSRTALHGRLARGTVGADVSSDGRSGPRREEGRSA